MKKVLLSHTGAVVSEMHVEENTNTLHFTETMPGEVVGQILDANHEKRRDGHNKKAEGRHVASMPSTLWWSWKKEWKANASNAMTWQEFLVKKLNDPHYAHLRTWGTSGGLVA